MGENNTVYYIVENSDYKNAMKRVANRLVKQVKFNRKVTLFCVVTSIYILGTDLYLKEHDKKIKKLETELEELKKAKGE